jgi:hypothetical protein
MESGKQLQKKTATKIDSRSYYLFLRISPSIAYKCKNISSCAIDICHCLHLLQKIELKRDSKEGSQQ